MIETLLLMGLMMSENVLVNFKLFLPLIKGKYDDIFYVRKIVTFTWVNLMLLVWI